MSRLFASVIVPTFGREEVLCNTLECLIRQDYPRYEILVVDQTPLHSPATTEFLSGARKEGKISLIQMKAPCSPGARNVGVRAASGEIVVLVDDDVLVESDWLSTHIRAFSDPEIGAVTGRVIYKPNLDLGIDGQPTGIYLRDGRGTGGFGRTTPAYTDSVRGGNLSVRRDIFIQVGGYDEEFTGNGFREESDFALRVRAAGYLIYFEPGAQIVHLKAPTGGQRLSSPGPARQSLYFVRNDTRFFLKNFPHRDLPYFVRRYFPSIFLPSVRFAIQSGRLADAFPVQMGLMLGLQSYIKHPETVARPLEITER